MLRQHFLWGRDVSHSAAVWFTNVSNSFEQEQSSMAQTNKVKSGSWFTDVIVIRCNLLSVLVILWDLIEIFWQEQNTENHLPNLFTSHSSYWRVTFLSVKLKRKTSSFIYQFISTDYIYDLIQCTNTHSCLGTIFLDEAHVIFGHMYCYEQTGSVAVQ